MRHYSGLDFDAYYHPLADVRPALPSTENAAAAALTIYVRCVREGLAAAVPSAIAEASGTSRVDVPR